MSPKAAAPHPPPASRWAVFVRAVRPFALWTMALGIVLQVLVLPIAAIFSASAVAAIQVEILRILVEGVLGLGAFRTIDKLMGKAT